jgi:HAD superfamily hydrolase (TIGR01450 family)
VGALTVGLDWLAREGHRRLGWLGAASLEPWLRERGFEPVPAGDAKCDAVVLGVDPELRVEGLDQALRWLRQGAVLLCLHRNRFWLDRDGRPRLGPGAWAAALEAAAPGTPSFTAGKPEPAVYRQALESLGASPAEALFISDDPFSDLVGARRLGLFTVLVLSGKYPDPGILATLSGTDRPDLVLARADQLRRDTLP